MDIVLLRTFLEVARTRHFGEAAEHLGVTQGAVSARIKLLEVTLGASLFSRQRNHIALTPPGHRLLRHAQTIVRSWTRAQQELALDGRSGRFLAVGCQLGLWPFRVPEWAARLRTARPDLALQLEVQAADVLAQRLASDLLTLAIMFDPPRSQEFAAETIGDVELMMVADQPGLAVAEAVAGNYILVNWGTPFMTAHSDLFPELPGTCLRLSQGLMALDLLTQVGGAAYVARPMAAPALAAGTLHPVADAPLIRRPVYAAYRADDAAQAPLDEALRVLRGLP